MHSRMASDGERSRRRQIPEPEPSALGHRAFKARLAAATTAAELTALIKEITEFFPKVAGDHASGRINLARWEGPYNDDPAGTYRTAAPPVRNALDRRVWADATARLLEFQAFKTFPRHWPRPIRRRGSFPKKTLCPAQLIDKAAANARKDLENLGSERSRPWRPSTATSSDRPRKPARSWRPAQDPAKPTRRDRCRRPP